MADTLTISIVDQSVAAENPVNIAVINQPNPVSGFTASAEQILDLLAFPKYFITDDGTGKPVNGDNFYDYFPDLDPSHGGGGGGGTTILSGDTDPSSAEGDDGDLYMKTTDLIVESVTFTNPQRVQTDYYMNKDSVVVFDCMLPAPSNTYDTHIGSRGNVDHFLAYDGGTLRYVYDGDSGNIGDISSCYDKRSVFTFSRTQVKVECEGSTIYDTTINGGNTTSTTHIGFFSLFTDNDGNDNNMTRANGTFYGCKIYENNTLVKDFIPFKDSNGTYCIKDTISGTVFTPVGSPTGTEVHSGDDIVTSASLKVNGAWQNLVGSRLEDINTGGGGGGTGTDDYNQLSNKPSINSVTLQGNVTDSDLGIQNCIYDSTTDELYTIVDGARVVLVSDIKAQPLIPKMTNKTTPSGTIDNGGYYGYGQYGTQNIWNAFDQDPTTYVTYNQEGVTDGWVSYEFESGNSYYVTKIILKAGNHKVNNSISASLYVYDDDGVERLVDTQTITGYAAGSYKDWEFTVNQNVRQLKFVFGYKTSNTNVYTYEIQAYGFIS